MKSDAQKDVMIYLNSSRTTFRCSTLTGLRRTPCNGNVFRRISPDKVLCNSCDTEWVTSVPEFKKKE